MKVGRWLALAALVVAAADLAQPLLLDWRPKFVGSIGGAMLYSVIAWGVLRDARWALWMAAALPAVPSGVICLHLLGVSLPTPPDFPMVAILVVQVGIAAVAVMRLRTPR